MIIDYSLDIDFLKYDLGKTYLRNGKRCIFDPIRKMLVIQTPEEIVRQKFIRYIIDVLKVPENMIEVEVTMTHYKKGAKDRADIVIFGKDKNEDLIPQAIIECKAPNVPIVDEVWYQVYKYNEVLNADLVITTNGYNTYAATWDSEDQCYYYLEELLPYNSSLEDENVKIICDDSESWKRPKFTELLDDKIVKEFKDLGWIGEGTSKELYPLIIDLAGFLQDTATNFAPISLNAINIVEDGHRYSSYGNAAGGSWIGDYRYFVLEDKEGNNQIISISILGSLKCENHPKFKNRKGHTTLVVAIDDFDKRHNSLQLNIDKYTIVNGKKFTIWHDCTITVGKNGAVKREELISFVKTHEPNLLNDKDEIILGIFNSSNPITWTQLETKRFIERLIRYALVRDRFRDYKKST